MATPVGAHIHVLLKSVGNPMVQLLFVWIGFSIRFADALRNDFCETFSMACVLAVFALHPSRIFEELSAKCTAHDAVELLLHKSVTILLLDFLFTLPDSAFAVESNVKADFASVLFGWITCQLLLGNSNLTY